MNNTIGYCGYNRHLCAAQNSPYPFSFLRFQRGQTRERQVIEPGECFAPKASSNFSLALLPKMTCATAVPSRRSIQSI